MAETSGFFQAQWDDNLTNPITEQQTGWWDRDYTAQSFADYFALFIGNGVFGSPTNQCKVIPGTGMSVIVTPGWGFINGCWYHNDSEKVINIPSNTGSSSRMDSIKMRYSNSSREISVLGFTSDTSVLRTSSYYDLKLAEITVLPGVVEISAANITDTRTNEQVCGFVKGLMEVETTADLFAQYEAQFNAWFDTVKNQVTGDLAIRLQTEFTQINADVQQYEQDVEDFYANVNQAILDYKSDIAQDISDYEVQIANQISGYNTNYQQVLDNCEDLVEEYTTRDFIISEQTFTFTNKQCRINNSKVTATSLVDVYFTQATISEAVRCAIYVESYDGYILMTAQRTPTSQLRGTIGVRVR